MRQINTSNSQKHSEEALMGLSAAASAADRANQPRWMIFAALVLLAITALYALLGVTARASAATEQRRAQGEYNRILDAALRLDAAIALRDNAANPSSNVPVVLETLAQQSRPPLSVQIASSTVARRVLGRVGRMQYDARISEQDPEAIFAWLNDALSGERDALKGLRIDNLEITPGRSEVEGPGRWNATITFYRWQNQDSGS